jgi:hypothetical protein
MFPQNNLSKNNILDNSLETEFEFDFALCHGSEEAYYHSYRYCRICV